LTGKSLCKVEIDVGEVKARDTHYIKNAVDWQNKNFDTMWETYLAGMMASLEASVMCYMDDGKAPS
jgi:hypothetical protein